MSAMSTSIEDLPGPLPQELTRELRNDISGMSNDFNSVDLQVQPTNSNIHANVKKRVTFEDEHENQDLLSSLKSEINEENILLAAVLLAAALPQFTQYVKDFPLIGSYATSDFMTSIIKAAILVIVFILFKLFILPKIRL
jgi:hypothetical protein